MSSNRAANDGDLVRRWCVADKGLAVKSCLDMSADLLLGKVMNVMPEFKPNLQNSGLSARAGNRSHQ